MLVIDDDPAMLRTVGEALEPQGYEVLTAPSGPAGLEITRKRPLSLILLDIGMPEMDGFAFMAAYRATQPAQAPVVVLTGRLDDARWRDDGAILDRVTKPFDIDNLLQVVDTHAGSSAEADRDRLARAWLARIAGQRDPGSLQAVYELYAMEGLGVCVHILRDRMLAEDALQDAFLQVWHKAQTFDPARGDARKWVLASRSVSSRYSAG